MVTLVWGGGEGVLGEPPPPPRPWVLIVLKKPCLLPLHIPTLCGSERVWVVSTEPPDDLSSLTTPGGWLSQRWAVARTADQVHADAHSESMPGLPTSALTCARRCAACRILFPTGAFNNRNDSFPFVLPFGEGRGVHKTFGFGGILKLPTPIHAEHLNVHKAQRWSVPMMPEAPAMGHGVF